MSVATGYTAGAIALMIIFFLASLILLVVLIVDYEQKSYLSFFRRINYGVLFCTILAAVIACIPFYSKAPVVPVVSVSVAASYGQPATIIITNYSDFVNKVDDIQLWWVGSGLHQQVDSVNLKFSTLNNNRWTNVVDRIRDQQTQCGPGKYVVRAFTNTLVYSESDKFALC